MVVSIFYFSVSIAGLLIGLAILFAWGSRYFDLSKKVFVAVMAVLIGGAAVSIVVCLFIVVNFSPFFTHMEAG